MWPQMTNPLSDAELELLLSLCLIFILYSRICMSSDRRRIGLFSCFLGRASVTFGFAKNCIISLRVAWMEENARRVCCLILREPANTTDSLSHALLFLVWNLLQNCQAN